MKITLVQDIIHWADKTANLQRTENNWLNLPENRFSSSSRNVHYRFLYQSVRFSRNDGRRNSSHLAKLG